MFNPSIDIHEGVGTEDGLFVGLPVFRQQSTPGDASGCSAQGKKGSIDERNPHFFDIFGVFRSVAKIELIGKGGGGGHRGRRKVTKDFGFCVPRAASSWREVNTKGKRGGLDVFPPLSPVEAVDVEGIGVGEMMRHAVKEER